MKRIFVFGSNLAGRHGAGAAKFAVEKFGAVYGQGNGLQGSSYAIPTKDEKLRTLQVWQIQLSVFEFLQFANQHPELTFNVTRIGCGLAGYTEKEMAPLFRGAPKNCVLPKGWRDL